MARSSCNNARHVADKAGCFARRSSVLVARKGLLILELDSFQAERNSSLIKPTCEGGQKRLREWP